MPTPETNNNILLNPDYKKAGNHITYYPSVNAETALLQCMGGTGVSRNQIVEFAVRKLFGLEIVNSPAVLERYFNK